MKLDEEVEEVYQIALGDRQIVYPCAGESVTTCGLLSIDRVV